MSTVIRNSPSKGGNEPRMSRGETPFDDQVDAHRWAGAENTGTQRERNAMFTYEAVISISVHQLTRDHETLETAMEWCENHPRRRERDATLSVYEVFIDDGLRRDRLAHHRLPWGAWVMNVLP